MKTIKSTITYKVPHWKFCNVDRFDMDGTPSKQVCQFCVKEKSGHRCTLYNEPLFANGVDIQKLSQCCRATAGFESVIEAQTAPTIPPNVLMEQTIAMYCQAVNDLINKGYPRQMAEVAARQHILGGNNG